MRFILNVIRVFFVIIGFQNMAMAGVEPAVSVVLDGKYFVDYTYQSTTNPDYYQNASFDNFVSGLTSTELSFRPGQSIRKIDNLLQLSLDPNTIDYIDFPFTLKVEIQIEKYENQAISTSFSTAVLEINYDPKERTKWNEKAIYHFANCGKASYIVNSVTLTSNSSPLNEDQKRLVSRMVKVQSDIIIERYYGFDVNDRLYLSDLGKTYNTSTNELTLKWNQILGAELYDLEWTWIDSYDGNGGYIFSEDFQLFKHYDLERNSTRVQISERRYTFPLVYESGLIYFRVRAIGKSYDPATDKVYMLPGKWSNGYNNLPNGPEQCPNLSQSDCGDHIFQIPSAHEGDKKNWQITTSYAELGKRKDVISYMDGTYRNRQSITGLSTDRMTLIGESIYDHQGRAAINVLPVPVNDPMLKYYSNFNQNGRNQSYSREDFDHSDPSCILTTKGMNTSSGASRYYSTNNPNKRGYNAYIPDAEKFPFVQTEFTPDNTGRVRRQSGVGANHNFGSGHETEYFYGTMAQEEGAMLFGVEFGEASHYKKNVAKDPNGQLSVTMLDLKGNVIATALAGTPPKNVDALKSYDPYPMSIDLMAFNQTDIFDNALVSSRSFTVTTESEYDFTYKMSNDAYHAALCDGKEICLDCVYDLEIVLIDNYSCNEIKYEVNQKVGPFAFVNDTTLVIKDKCDGSTVSIDDSSFLTAQNRPNPFKVKLAVGSYTITKNLRVNEQVTDAYVDHYMKTFQDECASIYEDILADQLSRVDSTDCFLDDDEKSLNRCDLARMGMLFDVSPGGQYGGVDFSTYNSSDPLSVFNASVSNKLSHANSDWRHPLTGGYKDGLGNRNMVYDPEINQQVYPEALTKLKNFIQYWEPSWAESLLHFHPEYCYLDWCENLPPLNGKSSFDFDVDLAEITSYNDGVSSGTYFAPMGSNNAPFPNDPYFKTGAASAPSIAAMTNEIAMYDFRFNTSAYTMMEIAVMTALQEAGRPSTQPVARTWIQSNQTSSADTIADKVWQTFIALYLSKKEYYQYRDRTIYAMNTCGNPNLNSGDQYGGYNECIGSEPFNWNLNGFGGGGLGGKFFSSDQACAAKTFQLYKDKTKRFPSAYDLPGNYDPYGDPQDVLNQGGDWANSMISDNCGCQCDSDLQQLLNNFFQDQPGFSNNPLSIVPPNLVRRVNRVGNGAVLQDIDFNYSNYNQNGPQSIEFGLFMDDGSSICIFEINIDSGSQSEQGFELVDSIDCPTFETSPNGAVFAKTRMYYGERITAVTIQVDPSCTLFEACDNQGETCPPTEMAKELSGLFSALIANNELDKNVMVRSYLGSQLKNYYKSLITQPIAIWDGNRTGNQITGQLSNGQKSCTFILNLPTGINLNTLGAIQSFTPDNTQIDPSTGYSKSAILKVAILSSSSTIEIEVSNTCFTMSYCLKCPPGGLVAAPFPGGPIGTQQQLPSGYEKISSEELKKLKKELKRKTSNRNKLINTKTAIAARNPRKMIALHDPNKICDECEVDKYTMTYDSMGVIVNRMPPSDICDPCSWSVDTITTITIPNPCIEEQVLAAYANAYNEYQRILDSLELKVRNEYIQHCLGASEAFTVDYSESMHHFTLYYYDQANNLLQTVPPAGVDLLNQSEINQAIQYMQTGTGTAITPKHDMISEYTYNSLNQLRKQKIPDHDGESIFLYDQLSRIVCSQNAEQRPNKRCSYTLYDDLGRVYEAGELLGVNSLPNTSNMNAASFRNWTNTNSFTKREVTRSIYDQQTIAIANQHFDGDRSNYRGRIASVQYYESKAVNLTHLTHATHYKYDIHGNVKALVQDLNLLEAKKMTYDYDLISGNVHQVNYQPEALDQFVQKYQYDADNRLITAESSRDGFIWDTEAEYYYYNHGPLARVELGEHKVQGIDYAYTIQGWIKGVNSATLNNKADIGQDGLVGSSHQYIAKDATGYMLRYFTDDYKSIANTNWEPDYRGSNYHLKKRDLFNGNINSMITAIDPMKNGKLKMGAQAHAFTYDQLHRIKSSQVFKGLDVNNNSWGNANAIDDYATDYRFDPNGNLLRLNRNGSSQSSNPLKMDKLKYKYISGTNKLDHVEDRVPDGDYKIDIDNQKPGNYKYDRIGNLIHDDSENMSIEWNVSGKVNAMENGKGKVFMSYGPMGNRVSKLFDNGNKLYTFYILDATGIVMATYTSDQPADAPEVKWQSAYIYGGSRLAEERIDTSMQDLSKIQDVRGADRYTYRSRGSKYYELTEHRNNVLATVSDRKLAIDKDRDKKVDFYEGDIWNVSDYYPYGMQMMDRNESFADSRFGFQGQEKDDEMKGEGNSINYKYRMHDARLGRFFAVDPLSRKFPFFSSYQFSGNIVVSHIELEGLEGKVSIVKDNTTQVSNEQEGKALKKVLKSTIKQGVTKVIGKNILGSASPVIGPALNHTANAEGHFNVIGYIPIPFMKALGDGYISNERANQIEFELSALSHQNAKKSYNTAKRMASANSKVQERDGIDYELIYVDKNTYSNYLTSGTLDVHHYENDKNSKYESGETDKCKIAIFYNAMDPDGLKNVKPIIIYDLNTPAASKTPKIPKKTIQLSESMLEAIQNNSKKRLKELQNIEPIIDNTGAAGHSPSLNGSIPKSQ